MTRHAEKAEKPSVPPRPLRWPIIKVNKRQKIKLAKVNCLRLSRFESDIPMKDDPRNTACRVGIMAKGNAKLKAIKVMVSPAEALTDPKL